MSKVEEYLKRAESMEEEEEDGSYKAYKEGRRAVSMSLDVRLKSGRRVGLSYTYRSSMELNGDTLIVRFTDYIVKIVGRNLKPVYDLLLEHKIMWVQEWPGGQDMTPEASTFIESIEVAQRA